MRCSPYLATLVLLGVALPALAATYVVHPDGTGDYPTIQGAIDAATDGDVIDLVDGIFTGDGNRDIEYFGKAITVRSQSGNAETCIIDCQGSASDPHRGFQIRHGEGPGSVLEAVTITGGYAELSPTSEHRNGGAMRIEDSSPTILRCRLVDNTAALGAGGVQSGPGGAPRFEDCYFAGNVALVDTPDGLGGGGALGAGNDSQPTVVNCLFESNVSYAFGGGIATGSLAALPDPTTVMVVDCTFLENQAGSSAGCAAGFGSTIIVENSFFARNQATVRSGAVGAGIFARLIATGSTFVENVASYRSVSSASLFEGDVSTLTFDGCTFYGNVNTEGAGTGILGCGSDGSADGILTIRNSIIAFNPSGQAVDGAGHYEVGCTNIYGNGHGDFVGPITGFEGTNGNISLDPYFCDASGNDFSLHDISPCVPASGSDCRLMGAWPVACEATPVVLDLKPGSCPNAVNLNAKGLLPAAILGTHAFDVMAIDPSSIRLQSQVSPSRWAVEDVATPLIGELCECWDAGSDASMDLTLKFHTWSVRDALGEVTDGEEVPVTVTGWLNDGSAFMGMDCLTVRGPGSMMEANVDPVQIGLLAPLADRDGSVRLSYSLPRAETLTITVYDLQGRQVATMVDGVRPAGEHVVAWDGRNRRGALIGAGVYFVRLETSGTVQVQKLVIGR